MSSGLRLGGLSSGLDTETIVSQLMAIERQPRARLERKQAAVQARQDALRDIQTKLRTLKSAAQAIASAGTWTPTQNITSSDSARVGARVVGSVTPGTYNVEVQQLATYASRTLNTQVRANPATFKITTISTGAQYSIAIPANATVDDIVRVINADTASPVAARNYNGQLLVSAKVSGAAGNFTFDGQNVVTSEASAVAGVDAQFKVNGASYTRSSNTVTDAIAGAELTLNGLTTAGSPIAITVSAPTVDGKNLGAKVKAFVDAYNAVVDATRSRTTEKRVANATNTIDAKKGVLFGDSALTGMLSQLRRSVSDSISVGNSLTMDEFAEIGVSTGVATGGTSTPDSLAGKLVYDEAKFLKAYEADPSSVERLLRGTAVSQGLAARMDAVLVPYTEGGGMFDGRITASGSELTRLSDQLKRMDERLGRKETYLRRQFTTLETALSKLNSQSAELSARLPGTEKS
ncbi:MAG: flagellar filament capping protein FliD [Actinomycetota bacterium]|nr:flagellar filament capping protein FliD [Actinomycetota bacterium]MDQ5808381.1 flagellar filament capping protein FliD [Actinomycetota bacterium]